ncbi:MAG: tripartite tricarboxylate transporter substrate binding protein [Betaproteobacteria bacterium]|nr:tripartite tricarboxylate transporter substrate binding protein [Betaproteobacteria bacterium]
MSLSSVTTRRAWSLPFLVLPLALLQPAAQALAQAWPAKPIRIIVPTVPGGPTDFAGRVLAERLAPALGQQVLVDNRPGAGHSIGTDIAAKSPPDGYTLVLVTTPHVVNPSLMAKLPFDPIKDFAPISMVNSLPFVLLVTASLPVASVTELVALAKARPGQLNMASSGNGTGPHLAGELFKLSTGISAQHIPFKGGPQATAALINGDVAFQFDSPLSLVHAKSGKLKALAVSSTSRSPIAPEVPTMQEAGIADYEAISWNGLLAPAGTPRDIIARLNSEVVRLLAQPEVRARLAAQAFDIIGSSPEVLAQRIASDIEKWARVVKASGMRAE